MFVIDALGVAIGVEVSSHAAESDLRADWTRCLTERSPQQQIHLASTTESVATDLRYRLSTEVIQRAIEGRAGELLMLHAAGLSDAHGRVTAMIAASGTGKTTAVRRLGEKFGYVTDELIGIDPKLAVYGVPRPLSVVPRQRSSGTEKVSVRVDALRPHPSILQLGRLLLLDRDDTHFGPIMVENLLGIDAVKALIPHCCALPALAKPLQFLAQVIGTAGLRRVRYREADDLAALLNQDDGWPRDAVSHSHQTWRTVSSTRTHGPGWRRNQVDDVLACGGEALLLVGAQPIHLSALGLAVWEALGRSGDLDAIVASVVATFGPAPEARDVVLQALVTLRDAGAVSH